MGTIPQDVLWSFALAQVVALSGSHQILESRRIWRRPFQETLLFLAAIFLPASYSFYHFWPDWTWLYAFDTQAESSAWTWLAFVLIYGAGVAGYAVAHRSLLRGRRQRVRWTLGSALALSLLPAALFPSRFFHLGAWEDFVAGKAPPLHDVGPFVAHLGVALVFVGSALWVIVLGHRKSRDEGR
jgi:hypothetical protein